MEEGAQSMRPKKAQARRKKAVALKVEWPVGCPLKFEAR